MAKFCPRYLAELNPAGFLLPPVKQRLCLLTGQSNFATSDLPLDKKSFLQAVAPSDVHITMVGFPWHADFTQPVISAPSLLAASARNARQWIWKRSNACFRHALSSIIGTALQRTEERLLLIAGSCGADFLAHALCDMPANGPEIWVVMLGPAGGIPTARYIARQKVIQGHQDCWSRMLWKGTVHMRPACGHLDYYTNQETIAATSAFFAGES